MALGSLVEENLYAASLYLGMDRKWLLLRKFSTLKNNLCTLEEEVLIHKMGHKKFPKFPKMLYSSQSLDKNEELQGDQEWAF